MNKSDILYKNYGGHLLHKKEPDVSGSFFIVLLDIFTMPISKVNLLEIFC